MPILHVQFERVVHDIEFFHWFITRITQGYVKITSDFIQNYYTNKRVNYTSINAIPAIETFGKWEAWKQWFVIQVLNKNNLYETYSNLGYNLDFCFYSQIADFS